MYGEISFDAVVKRINRRLAKNDEKLRVARSERARTEIGDFFIVDVAVNGLLATHVDPEALARVLGVLHASERVADRFRQ